MRLTRTFTFFLILAFGAMLGCNAGQKNVADLQRQKDDTLYEIRLRQAELDGMRLDGMRPEWENRKNALTEKITELRVKAHDLDLQIAAATK